MRIHSPEPGQPIRRVAEEKAWQVMRSGVRPVLIRDAAGARAMHVSPLIRDKAGQALGYLVRTVICLLADLFRTEGDARRESTRRRTETRSTEDRRRLLPVPENLSRPASGLFVKRVNGKLVLQRPAVDFE